MSNFKTSAILELIDKTAKGSKSAMANFKKLEKAADGFNKEASSVKPAKTFKEFEAASRSAKTRLDTLKRSARDGVGDFNAIQREIKQTTKEIKDLNKANRGFQIGGAIGTGLRRGGAIAGAGGLLALGAGIKSTFDFANEADEIGKFASRVGFATDSISELRFVVGQTAGDEGLAALNSGLTAFNRRLGELRKGRGELSSLNDEFKNTLLSARTTEEAFVLFIKEARGLEDISETAALLDKGLSEAGRKLVNFANTSEKEIASLVTEAQELGIVISDLDAQKAAGFLDELDKLKQGFKGVGFVIGSQLIEPFTKFFVEVATPRVKEFVAFLKEIDSDQIEAGFDRVAETLGGIVDSLAQIAGFIDSITVSANEKNANIAKSIRTGAIGREAGIVNPFRRQEAIDRATAQVDRDIISGSGRFSNTDPEILSALRDIARNTSGGSQSDGSIAPNVTRSNVDYALTRQPALGQDGLIPVIPR